MKTALIIALICLIIGAILVGAGWAFLQKNPPQKNTIKDTVYRYTLEETPTQINVTTLDSRVELRPIEGNEWRVECMDKEKLYHTVALSDGVLTVKQIDEREWIDHVGILNGLQNLSVIVYLPAKVYESLNIHAMSGSIKVQEGFTFSNASLQSMSGSVSCASNVTGALNVKNTSGSITVSGSVGGSLIAKNTSGSIRIAGNVKEHLNVENTSGRIEIQNVTPARVTVKNVSGGIYLENVVCQASCEITNASGSIELVHCDAMSFDLRSTSGGIRASILSAKTFDCRSTSGGVHVPKDGNGGTFRAKTTSGGIKITVVE